MTRALIPLVLLLLGSGGGVAAALLLAPPPGDAPPVEEASGEPAAAEEAHREAETPKEEVAEGHDYLQLSNQFVVPLVTGGRVASLVLLTIAVEVRAGEESETRLMEPKLRDLFLQVLFDHANAGGFDGLFTAGSVMRELRGSLLRAAQDELGQLVTDVLILDIVRQDQ